MRASVDYASLVAQPSSDAHEQVLAALSSYCFQGVQRLWNPTSGRDDGVTSSRTAVVIAEDERGRRLCVKFYEDSEEGRRALQWHATCLAIARSAVAVPRVVAVESEAGKLGLPALVTAYVGEPLDHAIFMLSDRARITLAEDIADSLVALSRLDLTASGLQMPAKEELHGNVARRFADDAQWYVEHAPAADANARGPVLHGARILANAEVAVSAASLCHRDLVGSNITVRNGLFSGFVDWDYAGVDPPELDLGSCVLGFLVTIPIPKRERLRLLQAMLTRYGSQAETMPLLFALDALLDWTIGGKDAPMDDLIWATSGVIRAIQNKAPLCEALQGDER
jgi:aminoglycoside phosphotransferase (APT) family kinase protein